MKRIFVAILRHLVLDAVLVQILLQGAAVLSILRVARLIREQEHRIDPHGTGGLNDSLC